MAKLSARGRKEYWRATKVEKIENEGHVAHRTTVRAYLSDGTILIKTKMENGEGSTPFTGWKQFGKWRLMTHTRDIIKRLEEAGWQVQKNTSL